MKPRFPKLLLFLNILVALSALVAIYAQSAGLKSVFTICKPLTTILIICILLFFGHRDRKPYFFSTLIALLFCLAGDIFLLEESRFVYGLASFLVAHVLFTYSFTTLGGWKFYKLPIIILLLFGIGFYAFIKANLGDLSIPVAVYILVILTMAWQGLSLYLWKKSSLFLWMGAAVLLFLFSDAVIAINKFKFSFELAGFLILSTYWLSITIFANAAHFLPSSLSGLLNEGEANH